MTVPPPSTPQQLAADLRRLDALPVAHKSDLSRWYDAAQQVIDALKRSAGVSHVPHALWHWFSDRDLRFKEPEYARQQAAELRQMLEHLDAGRWGAPE